MSYQVISRKYRPQVFDDVIGQEHISYTLRNAIKNDRVAHAYLFSGSRGIGKTTTARILSKTLNCQHVENYNPCNKCSSCIEITEGRSVNISEIDGASNRGINEIRELRENVKYPPAGGAKYRIFIIDEVHMLTKEAFNALLKTLEEPPPHVLFIFATTEPIKIPDTIISRCQRYDFHRISVKKIVEQLQKVIANEQVKVDDSILTLIAKKADGGMRDAESLLDQIISFSGDEIIFEDAQRILGLIDFEYYMQLGDLIFESNQKELLIKAEEIFNKGVELGEFFKGFSEHFRNLLIANVSGSVEMLDLPENAKLRYRNESGKWDRGDLLRIMKMISDSQVNLKTALNQRTFLEYELLRLGNMEKTVDIQNILNLLTGSNINLPISAGQKKKVGYKNEHPKPIVNEIAKPSYSIPTVKKNIIPEKPKDKIVSTASKQEENDFSLTSEELHSKWKDIIYGIQEERAHLGAVLGLAEVEKLENNQLNLNFAHKFKFQMNIFNDENEYIEQKISRILGHNIKITCSLKEKSSEKHEETKSVTNIANEIAKEFDGEIII